MKDKLIIKPLLKEFYGKHYGLEIELGEAIRYALAGMRRLNSCFDGDIKKLIFVTIGRKKYDFYNFDEEKTFKEMNRHRFVTMDFDVKRFDMKFFTMLFLYRILKRMHEKYGCTFFMDENNGISTNFRFKYRRRSMFRFQGNVYFASYDIFIKHALFLHGEYHRLLHETLDFVKQKYAVKQKYTTDVNALLGMKIRSVFLPVSNSFHENCQHVIYKKQKCKTSSYIVISDGWTYKKHHYEDERDLFRKLILLNGRGRCYVEKHLTDREKAIYENNVKEFLKDMNLQDKNVEVIW